MIATSEIEILDRASVLSNPLESFSRLTSTEGALLLLEKPYAETSFFMVNRIRSAITRATGIRKIKCGHAGTLDPLATGLLIIATRGKTKALMGLIGMDKTYLLRMRFGVTSRSFDLEQPMEFCEGAERLTEAGVRKAIESLPGEHNQMPPIFSAIKQKGQPVYIRARAGKDVTMVARVVQVHEAEVVSINLPEVTFRVRVSKGTYVRSIVRDLAASLGTCGLLIDLVRERIGEWSVDDALTLTEAIGILDEAKREHFDPVHHS
ncbi:MAG TPA: tRNA pseudouridine(55) synthase TruB [Candidatus Kapabacteria bacterium]|nr:tRNA pseudouridine(55) synthase TruB [Candidatus Kapabacteria bacterium]